MSAFQGMKDIWTIVSKGDKAFNESNAPFERLGGAATATGTMLTSLAPAMGVAPVAGPLIGALGLGMEMGGFADRKLGLSTKISDATYDTDERNWDEGLPPVHFRGPAGNAEAELLNIGRQQSFLKDETARQVDIAKWAKAAGEQGTPPPAVGPAPFSSAPRGMLKTYGIDLDAKDERRRMMGLFGHLAE